MDTRALWSLGVAVGLALASAGGCKKDAPAPARPGCTKSTDCAAGQWCKDGACIAEEKAPVADTPCDRALANVQRLNDAQGKSAMNLDFDDLRKQCATWPPEVVTCFEGAKDQRGYSKCATDLFNLEKAKLKARKAEETKGPTPAPTPESPVTPPAPAPTPVAPPAPAPAPSAPAP